MSVYIIAEVGPNHNGSIEIALEMIRLLAAAGADAVKFQLATPEDVYSQDAFKADYQRANDGEGSPLEMSRRVQLPFSAHRRLYEACRRNHVDYLSSAFDLESLRQIDSFAEMPFFKIPSGEIVATDILDYIATRERPILLSTGMATSDEVAAALDRLTASGPRSITLLHCVSVYPVPYTEVNLLAMVSLAKRFHRPVGYSDHSIGPECCVGAVALGAAVIEKHVTMDRDMPGPDHKASATIDEFAAMVRSVRLLEQALGDGKRRFSVAEQDVRGMARKSIVAVCDLPAGHVIARGDLCFKRPGTGIPPSRTDSLVGRRLRVSIGADRLITEDDFLDPNGVSD